MAFSLVAFALTYAGMTGLSFAMPRHYKQITGQYTLATSQRYFFKILGWLLLILALVPCMQAWGLAIGTVIWLGFLTAGGLLIVLLLPYFPRLAVLAAAFAGIIGVLMLFIS